VDSDPVTDLEFNWSLDGKWLWTYVGASYTYQPNYDAAGLHNVSVKVSERANPDLFVTANWSITVTNVNRGQQPETVVLSEPDDGASFREKSLISFRAGTATDPDGDSLSYTWRIDGEVVSTTQTFESKDLKVGDHDIELEVSDGDLSLTQNITITIREEDVEAEPLPMEMIVLMIIILIIVVLVVALAMRSRREKPVKDDEPDIYAADKAAMKEAMKKADKKEDEEEEDEEDTTEEE
jgi:hypothetical protein